MKRKNIWLMAALWMTLGAASAVGVTLDLAGKVTSQPISPGTISVEVVNFIPEQSYTIAVELREVTVPDLDLPEREPGADAGVCSQFLTKLAEAKSESDVKREIADQENEECKRRAKQLTSDYVGEYDVDKGEELVVKVTRAAAKNRKAKTWQFVLSTGPKGEWLTSYGFTFVPDQNDNFFTRQSAENPEEFLIEMENDPSGTEFDFIPSVLFNWYPGTDPADEASALRKNTHFFGGIGYDLEAPSVFGGVGYSFHKNISVVGGIAFHQQDELDGRYELGQVLKENLDSAQLNEEVYRANVFIGLSFRFNSDPFKNLKSTPSGSKESEEEEKSEEEQTAPDTTPASPQADELAINADELKKRLDTWVQELVESRESLSHQKSFALGGILTEDLNPVDAIIHAKDDEKQRVLLIQLLTAKDMDAVQSRAKDNFGDLEAKEVWLVNTELKDFRVIKRAQGSVAVIEVTEPYTSQALTEVGVEDEQAKLDPSELWKAAEDHSSDDQNP